jgi:hypothetical protein
VFEVLSDSTEAYDRGEKFRLYRTLPSLREYVLISQKQPLVEVFSRDESGIWEFRAYEGLDSFLARHHAHVARIDLLPPGAPRRDWRQTFLSDGNLVVRTPDMGATIDLAREAAAAITLRAG